jgi:hypothetical protein
MTCNWQTTLEQMVKDNLIKNGPSTRICILSGTMACKETGKSSFSDPTKLSPQLIGGLIFHLTRTQGK